MEKYYPRVADEHLKEMLGYKGAVLITGPRWCGKSTTAEQVAKRTVYIQDKSRREENITLLNDYPDRFFSGETPLLIDEWQLIPSIWDQVRFQIDKRKTPGQFILTGSVTPLALDELEHSGIGRISRMHMRTMSLYESSVPASAFAPAESTPANESAQSANKSNPAASAPAEDFGSIRLSDLFKGEKIYSQSKFDLQDYATALCRGGWPEGADKTDSIAMKIANDYVDDLAESVIDLAGVKVRDPKRLRRLLSAYARRICTPSSLEEIRTDILKSGEKTFNEKTLYEYVNALRQLFVIEDLDAWNPHILSRARVQSSPIRHFVDPSIATSALGISPNDLLENLQSFGLFFESMCIRDLRVYAESLGGRLYHYRDSSGLETDAVIVLRNGEYGLIEIKLGRSSGIEKGVATLQKLARTIDTTQMRAPSFLMVINSGDLAYRRPDGIYVVPLATLRP